MFGMAAAMAIAGCGGGSSGGDQGSPPITIPTHPHTHTATPTSPTPTATETPTAIPTATVTATSVAMPRCASSNLSLSLGPAEGAAGSTYVPIVLTNTGGGKCHIAGYPGVSFVDSSGTQLGKAAKREPGPIKTIKLASGESAYATLQLPNPGNFDPSLCNQTTANRLRVYPPDETTPLFIKDKAQICTTAAGRTHIRPLTSAGGG
jgi:hypothetical protein